MYDERTDGIDESPTPPALRAVLDQMPAGLVVAEAPSGRIVVFNEESERILGHPPIPTREVANYDGFGAVHDDGRAYGPHEHPLARALQGETLHFERVCYRRPNDALVELSVNAAPVRDASDRIVAAVVTFVDVDEGRTAEAELRRALETLVAQRTAELSARSEELDRANAELRRLGEGLEEQVALRTAELETSRARLAHEVQHDHLTGLPNRTLIEERLERAVATAGRYGRTLAVLFLDLDGFKLVNDTFGHNAGDEILRQVAGRLSAQLRTSDTLGRLGGDEFVAVITEVSESHDAVEVARSLLASIDAPFAVGDEAIVLSASVGISLYPDDALDPSTLQRHADIAMYAAKAEGKNRVGIYAAVDREAVMARLRRT
ncbi:hypothetical protein BH23DEI1_BH23DEI1_09690 [soil metagenome]|nr:diguanylate cyclase [Trueperaceae bacterium]